MAISYKILPLGAFEANCVVLTFPGGKTALVDPGSEVDLAADFVLLTHGHIDHIAGLAAIAPEIPVFLHPADAEWAFTAANIFPPYFKVPTKPQDLRAPADFSLLQTIPTPGHSPGSVCFYSAEDKLLIAGDTLFAGSVGRTDLQGGSSAELARSLRLLAELPDETLVISGHGPVTTIGEEKLSNPFIRHACRH